MSITYDIIYIGTGPINILDAYYQANTGKKVLMLDSKSQVGGAWVAIPVGDYGDLEIGCHIWSYNKKVYDFLENLLQLDLVDLKPQPYFLKRNSKIIYDHKNLFLTSKTIAKKLIRGKFKGTYDFIFSNPSSRMPIIPKRYKYPKGGAREFQEKLTQLIKSVPVDIKLNEEVEKIEYRGDKWQIKCKGAAEFSSDKVIMTATSHLKEISYKNATVKLDYSFINYTHFHIVIKGKPNKPISYIRVLDHDYIHRISDITYQLSDRSEDVSVLLIGVFDDKVKNMDDEDVMGVLRTYLIHQKFITEENEIIYYQKNRFPTAYSSGEQRQKINDFDDSIELLATTDLIYGLYFRMPYWKEKGFI
ncbi:MAG: FAD-dependent oxidoreductase [Crocinitomicaceae bacterium]